MPALVLIAESDPFNLRLLQEICEAAGHTVVTAMDGGSALEVIARKRPDLVMVDVGLPGQIDDLGGLEVLKVLKGDRNFASIPVLLTTAERDEDVWRTGIELGAEDYLSRPYRVLEIHQRVRNTLRRAWLERVQVGTEDPLLRAGSATQLPLTLEYEMTRALRFKHALSCVSLAITNFGNVVRGVDRPMTTDEIDTMMAAMTGVVRQCVRTIDHVFRGHDGELVLVLPETSAGEAEVVVHRLALRAEKRELVSIPVGVSMLFEVGVAGRPEHDHVDGLKMLVEARAHRAPLGVTT